MDKLAKHLDPSLLAVTEAVFGVLLAFGSYGFLYRIFYDLLPPFQLARAPARASVSCACVLRCWAASSSRRARASSRGSRHRAASGAAHPARADALRAGTGNRIPVRG